LRGQALIEFRVLGSFEVLEGERSLALGGPQQRALLAVLLLHRGETVSTDRLIDELWGEQAPASAAKIVQGYVSHLRRELGDGLLVTRGRGYRLEIAPEQVDIDRFVALVAGGRRALQAGDPLVASERLRGALALWRGPPLADFTYEPFAHGEIARLEEQQLAALEDRIDADLALGEHAALVSELDSLVQLHPLRERLQTQLMLALYRCGRQADALERYQQTRRELVDQLGIEPGRALRELERSILEQDPALDPPARRIGAQSKAARASTFSRRAALVVIGGALLLAVAATVTLTGGAALTPGGNSSGQGAPPSVIAGDSVGAISPASGAINRVVPVGSAPSSVVAGDGAVWVANYNDGTVSRIDLRTHAVVPVPAGSTPSEIAVGAGAVWVTNNFSGTVSRINTTVDRVVQRIPVGNGPSGVAVGDGSVWVTNTSDGTVTRINAVSGDVGKHPIQVGGSPTDVAVGADAVWVSDEAGARVLRIDPKSDQSVQAITVGNGPGAIAVGDGYVWVANSLDGTVSRINPQTNVAVAIPVGDGPSGIAVGAGGVWITNQFAGSVTRIDPVTRATHTIAVGNKPQGVAIGGGLVWVGAQPAVTSHRGGTLTVLSNAPFNTIDPALYGGLAPYLTLNITNDGLTAFTRVGGSDGAVVAPDLAVSLPTPTDGGRTYRFQLQRGIRYSNGAPLRPEDFRWGFERALTMNGAVAGLESIVGASTCVAQPARCDLRRGIVTSDSANTVTLNLVAPDPELLDQLAGQYAVAVPVGTPHHDVGNHPVPATGPYEIASDSPTREVRLVRNPYFHEWSPAVRPDGYPDQIIWKIGASTEAALTAVERSRADYTLDGVPPDRLTEVNTRYPGQLHITRNDVTIQLVLNTKAPPFNNLSVRRALNYAINRRKVARLFGPGAQPSCQLLAPYIGGYKPYCPYTLHPNRAGTWNAPDLNKAQALIAASGTRGMRITIWSAPGYLTDFSPAARYVASLLDRLGYRVKIKAFAAGDAGPFLRFLDPATKAQVATWVRAPAYPAPSQFVRDFQCPSQSSTNNPSEFCDPSFDATVRRAFAAETTNPQTAAQLWASADRQVTDQAPFVSLATPSIIDFVSRRVRNYEFSPAVGVLLDQLWVK